MNSEEKAELLLKYKASAGNKALRNEVVLAYMSLVKYIAIATRNMYLNYIDADDVINEAVIGLIGAIENFDVEKKVKFETYASIKIRGAIIDYIRRQDFIPRTIRKFVKDYDEAYSELYSTLKREPSSSEIAAFMKILPDRLEKYMAQAFTAQTISFEELVITSGFDIAEKITEDGVWETEAKVYKREKLEYLAKAIESLKDRERLVITLYYYEKLKLSDIGTILDISESRVCQIHTQAVKKMRDYMEEYMGTKRSAG